MSLKQPMLLQTFIVALVLRMATVLLTTFLTAQAFLMMTLLNSPSHKTRR